MNTAIRLSDSIGLLAARDPGIRDALETLGLDYYCAGDLSLEDAARGGGMDPFTLRARLEQSERGPGNGWQERSTRDLVTHLEHEHHQLLRSIVFHSAMLLNEAVTVNGPECAAAMRKTFRDLTSALILHIEKEEHMLFPLLQALEDAWIRGATSLAPPSDLRRMTARFVLEHAAIGQKLTRLHDQSTSLEPAASDVCRRLLHSLTELEQHIHESLNLENYVVFPRAIALEDDVHGSPPALSAVKNEEERHDIADPI